MTGEELIKLRIEHKLSQARLASKIGVTKATVNLYENGGLITDRRKAIIYKVFGLPSSGLRRDKSDMEAFKKLVEKRKEVMHRMDRRVERWSELDDDDDDLVELRRLYDLKEKQ